MPNSFGVRAKIEVIVNRENKPELGLFPGATFVAIRYDRPIHAHLLSSDEAVVLATALLNAVAHEKKAQLAEGQIVPMNEEGKAGVQPTVEPIKKMTCGCCGEEIRPLQNGEEFVSCEKCGYENTEENITLYAGLCSECKSLVHTLYAGLCADCSLKAG